MVKRTRRKTRKNVKKSKFKPIAKAKLTPQQTHIRVFKQDKQKLKRYMQRNKIKSETLAINELFKKLK